MAITETLDYLIPYLRLEIGDTNSSAYRYVDEWLEIALVASIESLGRWWSERYYINDSNEVYRNDLLLFSENPPPVIQPSDKRPIIIMAAIITLQGSLESSAWDLGSWKDAEISYSNIKGGDVRENNLKRLWAELESIMTPPNKRLARAIKRSLPGYKGNSYERNTDY